MWKRSPSLEMITGKKKRKKTLVEVKKEQLEVVIEHHQGGIEHQRVVEQ